MTTWPPCGEGRRSSSLTYVPNMVRRGLHTDRRRADSTDTQSLMLTKGFRHGYHILVNRKSDYVKLDKTRSFKSLSEGRSVKAYAYMVRYMISAVAAVEVQAEEPQPWSILGSQIETLSEKMVLAQKRAFIELRQMVRIDLTQVVADW